MPSGAAKRIVFHLPSLRGGGAERVFVLIANEMAARGHQVTLFVWNAEGPNATHVDPSVRLVSLDLPVRGEGFGKAATLGGLMKSALFLRRERPDAVFSALDFANLIITAALIIGRSQAAFFPTYHAAAALKEAGLGFRLSPYLARLIARRATKAVAVSEGIRRELLGRGFAAARVNVIHNPLPPRREARTSHYPWREKLASMGDGPVIVTLGRLVQVKDHRTLIKAFSLIDPSQKCRLVIFGEGPLEADLACFADELGVDRRVLFPGYVNDPAACYAIADLFVLSSLNEGFGNVLIEAMEAGLPIVSTDAPHGPREILDGGRFGALVPVGDPQALADAMQNSLAAPLPAADLKARAAEFEIGRIGDRYQRLIYLS